MKWMTTAAALLLVLGVHSTAQAQYYGGLNRVSNGYVYLQETPSAQPTPAPQPPPENPDGQVPQQAPQQVPLAAPSNCGCSHEIAACDSCRPPRTPLLWRPCLTPCKTRCCQAPSCEAPTCCAAKPGCSAGNACDEPACCSPTVLQRLHASCKTSLANVHCRVATMRQNWSPLRCRACGECTLGGCGCDAGVITDKETAGSYFIQPQPQPAPDLQTPELPSPEPAAKSARARSTQWVPSAWKIPLPTWTY